ncbi:hypothetical protein AALB51_14965 [Lachnospiraceae bacterium 62-26]
MRSRFDRMAGRALEALALERVNDRHIDSDCGCITVLCDGGYAGMDGEAMPPSFERNIKIMGLDDHLFEAGRIWRRIIPGKVKECGM